MRPFCREPGQSLASAAFYRFCRGVVELLATLVYRFRVFAPAATPDRGGLLVIANHVSHLDPPLIGAAMRGRNMRAIARSGLFKHALFARLIDLLGAIPIRENEGDMQAMRRAISEIQKGRVVLIFPEGTRSPDGELRSFKRGCWLLIQRARCDVLPAAIEGSHEVWPRGQGAPSLDAPASGCGVMFGSVIPFEQLQEQTGGDADRGLELLSNQVRELQSVLRLRLSAARSARSWGI